MRGFGGRGWLVVFLLAGVLVFTTPAHAALYQPGATLDPACAPTDLNCGVLNNVGSGTANQVPYYAGSGTALTATSTLTILPNGHVGVGTTTPGTIFGIGTTGINTISLSNTATSTFGHAVRATCFTTDGTTCITGGAGGSTNPGGSNGQVQFNNGGSFAGATALYYDSAHGRLGIGTTSPYAKLSVAGQVVGAYFTATSTTATSTFGSDVTIGAGHAYYIGSIRALQVSGNNNTWPGATVGWGNTSAGGQYAVAFGAANSVPDPPGPATGYASAFGFHNTASGWDAAAFGHANNTSAASASAFGINNVASGDTSTAFGYTNTASGYDTVAFGNNNIASSAGSSAFGNGITNTIASSTQIGPSNTAKLTVLSTGETQAPYFTATSTTATSTFAGGVNVGSGNGYFVSGHGILSYATNEQLNAGLGNTISSIAGSTAVGNSNNVSGSTANAAFGSGNTVTGTSNGAAIGSNNTVSGIAAIGAGNNNKSTAQYAATFGAYNQATSTAAAAIGYYNWAGNADASALGVYNSAQGKWSSAVGYYNYANGGHSSSFGYSNVVNGASASAFGNSNTIDGGGTAIGTSNTITAAGSGAAFGNGNTVSGTAHSYALGFGVTNSIADSMMLGIGGTAETILSSGNVGIGTTSPYAKLSVNGSAVADAFTAASSTQTSRFNGPAAFTGGLTSAGIQNTGKIYAHSSATSATTLEGYVTGSGYNNAVIGHISGSSGATEAKALYATADFNGISIANAYGLYVDPFTNATNAYGVYIAGQGSGASHYALYSAGGKSYFKDNVGIGTTSPYAKLSVVGNIVASTTATSTFTGGVDVGADTHYSIGGVPVLSSPTTGGSSGNIVVGVSNTVQTGGISYQTAVGNSNTISGTAGTGVGYHNAVTNLFASAVGAQNNAKSTYAVAFGSQNTVSGSDSNAFGYGNSIPASGATAVGNNITNSIANSTMIGPSNTAKVTILSSGNVGIGTTSPYSRLTVWGPDSAAGTAALTVANTASTTLFQVYDDGNATLAGTLTQNSDRRLKTDINALDASTTLALLNELKPVTFHWRDRANASDTQVGFIAQDVQKVFPELVATTAPTKLTPNGTLGVNYIGLVSPLVEGVKALYGEVTSLSGKVAGFAQSFTTQVLNATTGNFTTVNSKKLCLGKTCVTENQLKNLLSNENSSSNGSGNITTITTSHQPLSVTLIGSATERLAIGSAYVEQGATVSGGSNASSTTYQIYVNGSTTATSSPWINTGKAGNYRLTYTATDSAGENAKAVRTVIVGGGIDGTAGASSSSSQASSTPSQDNASSTPPVQQATTTPPTSTASSTPPSNQKTTGSGTSGALAKMLPSGAASSTPNVGGEGGTGASSTPKQ